MTARIVHVETETEDLGLTVRVTIRRIPRAFLVPNNPRPDDVPTDIREALRDWLATTPAETTGGAR